MADAAGFWADGILVEGFLVLMDRILDGGKRRAPRDHESPRRAQYTDRRSWESRSAGHRGSGGSQPPGCVSAHA